MRALAIDWENLPEMLWGHLRVVFGYGLGWSLDQLNRSFDDTAVKYLRINPADAIIEIGFRGGGLIRRIAAAAHAGFVAGVDPSPLMCEIARRRNYDGIERGRIDLRLCDPALLPWPQHRFDKAIAINTFAGWADPAPILRSIGRVLHPGGALLLVSHPNPLASLIQRAPETAGFSPILLKALPACGFRIENAVAGTGPTRILLATSS